MNQAANSATVRQKILEVLGTVVPEMEPATLRGNRPIRDELDVDSMDLLNFVIGLNKTFGIEIPEADYRRIATVDALVEYLVQQIGAKA
jgi:acyl carrier protein